MEVLYEDQLKLEENEGNEEEMEANPLAHEFFEKASKSFLKRVDFERRNRKLFKG